MNGRESGQEIELAISSQESPNFNMILVSIDICSTFGWYGFVINCVPNGVFCIDRELKWACAGPSILLYHYESLVISLKCSLRPDSTTGFILLRNQLNRNL